MKKVLLFLAIKTAIFYFIWFSFLEGLGYPTQSWRTFLVSGILTFYTVLVEQLARRAYK